MDLINGRGGMLPSPVALRRTWEGHALPRLHQKQRGRVVPSPFAMKKEGEGLTLPVYCHVASVKKKNQKKKAGAPLCPLSFSSSSLPRSALLSLGTGANVHRNRKGRGCPSPLVTSKTDREGQTLPVSCQVTSEKKKRNKSKQAHLLRLLPSSLPVRVDVAWWW